MCTFESNPPSTVTNTHSNRFLPVIRDRTLSFSAELITLAGFDSVLHSEPQRTPAYQYHRADPQTFSRRPRAVVRIVGYTPEFNSDQNSPVYDISIR